MPLVLRLDYEPKGQDGEERTIARIDIPISGDIGEIEAGTIVYEGGYLTPHETRILRVWANGYAQGDMLTTVGKLLNYHPNTIKYHRDRLYDKLGATTPANAVYIAMKRGLIE